MSVTREDFEPTNGMPVKLSLLILTNAKDNKIIDLILLRSCFLTSLLLYTLVNISG